MKRILLTTLLFIYFLPVINGQTDWTYSSLSQKKRSMGAVVSGSKVWFAGGEYYVKNGNGTESHFIDTIEIFDTKDQSKSFTKLSVARSGLNVATAGGKIFFAGGIEGVLPSGFFKVSDIVYIYDTSTGIWSVEKLSVARYEMVSAVVGDKVIFAGGRLMNYHVSDVVDIYDVSTELWSRQQLSMPTFGMGVAAAENKVYFAGGFDAYPKDNPDYFVRKRIDIYDVGTETWSIDSLSQARCYVGGAVVRDRILFAGGSLGLEQSNRVDIFNLKTQKYSMDSLSIGRSFLNNNVATVCDKGHFVGGDCYNVSAFLVGLVCNWNRIDIYDYQTNLVEAEVADGGHGLLVLRAALGDLAADLGPDAKPGERGALALRPELVRVAGHLEAMELRNRFAGRVRDLLYEGDVTLYTVEVEGGFVIEALLANASPGRARLFKVGDAVAVGWRHDAGVFIRGWAARGAGGRRRGRVDALARDGPAHSVPARLLPRPGAHRRGGELPGAGSSRCRTRWPRRACRRATLQPRSAACSATSSTYA